MHFSANDEKIWEWTVYGLRLVVGAGYVFVYFLPLLHLAERDMRVIQRFDQELAKAGRQRRRGHWWSIRYSPVLHCLRAWAALMKQTWKNQTLLAIKYQNLRLELAETAKAFNRNCLPPGSARNLQASCLKFLFKKVFGLSLTSTQTASFSCYPAAAMLMSDFLAFCLAQHRFPTPWPQPPGMGVLVEFERTLASHLPPEAQSLPPTETFTCLRSRAAVFWECFCHPIRSMAVGYDPRQSLLTSSIYQNADIWLLDALDNHLQCLGNLSDSQSEAPVPRFRHLLAWELHMHACLLACGVASAHAGPASTTRNPECQLGELFAKLRPHLAMARIYTAAWTQWGTIDNARSEPG